MRVKGPNGVIFHVSDDLGRALLATGGHQRVEEVKPKVEPKPKK